VYDHITDPSPVQLFKLQNLTKGDAKISVYNTVMTAEVDPNSSINKGRPNANLTQDLFREFKWSDGAGTLVPVAFPGIFPDLTRYQAEADQAQVNQGHQPWKLSATLTAQALAASQNLLKWSPDAPATIVSGGGSHDINAVVSVKSTHASGGTITVTMSRLEQNSNGGIWEVTSVTSPGISITTPQDRDRLTSPTTVTGKGNAFEGKIGKVIVLDHLYTDIGHSDAKGASGNGSTTFSGTVSYNASFKTGIQEGVVVLYSFSNADGSVAGAVMVKEMLS
jgi:Immunoglobulin-like domain of bacterial spore germination